MGTAGVLHLLRLTGEALHSTYELRCIWEEHRPCHSLLTPSSRMCVGPHAPPTWHSRKAPEVTGKSLVSGVMSTFPQAHPTWKTASVRLAEGERGLAGRHQFSSSDFLPSSSWGSRFINEPLGAQISRGQASRLRCESQMPPTLRWDSFPASDGSGARLPTYPSCQSRDEGVEPSTPSPVAMTTNNSSRWH